MFQGWTGTSYTVLHAHVSAFCINTPKEQGILNKGIMAQSAHIIDDGVIQIFPRNYSMEICKVASEKAYDATVICMIS